VAWQSTSRVHCGFANIVYRQLYYIVGLLRLNRVRNTVTSRASTAFMLIW
jgi:hypothetical protein